MYYVIPFIISLITYVDYIRIKDIYQIILTRNFNTFNSFYIFLFVTLNCYYFLIIYSTFRTYYPSYKKYYKIYYNKYFFNIDNKIIKVDTSIDEECLICLDILNILDNNVYKLVQCQHIYHYICIKEWYLTSNKFMCPTCRCEYNPKIKLD
jgi:hypothetical protein